jgi:hypothetical protein
MHLNGCFIGIFFAFHRLLSFETTNFQQTTSLRFLPSASAVVNDEPDTGRAIYGNRELPSPRPSWAGARAAPTT